MSFYNVQQRTSSGLSDIGQFPAEIVGSMGSAIIESGSNANGNYVKFADGTLICNRLGLWDGTPLNNQDSTKVFSWPTIFRDTNYIPTASPYGYAANRYCPSISDSSNFSTSTISIGCFSLDGESYILQNGNGRECGVMLRGIGKW